jgi:hypothetical protein
MQTENPILSEHVGITPETASEELKTVNELIGTMIDTCITLVGLNTSLPCKEFQLSIMDTQSMIDHLNKFRVDGPSTPFQDIPLADSEVQDPAWVENEDGRCLGDDLMSNEAE